MGLRKLLYILFIFFNVSAFGGDFYWIGNSGSFSDISNWSSTSGGNAIGELPGSNDNIFFDNLSFTEDNPVVTIDENFHVKSIHALLVNFSFNSLSSSNFQVSDLFKIGPNVKGDFSGKILINYANDITIQNNSFGKIHFFQGIQFKRLNNNSLSTLSNPGSGLGLLAHTLTITKTDVVCNGDSDGTATVTVSGGTGPFVYTWFSGGSPIGSTPTITDLGPGSYLVSVEDVGAGETQWGVATVNEPADVAAVISAMNHPLCFGDCNGDMTAFHIPGTGTGVVTFLWDDPGAQSTPTATGLCAGTYTVIGTDANGCTTSASGTLVDPDAFTMSTTQVDVTCNGDDDGSATAVPSGGTPAYTYLWDDGGASTTITISSLSPGTYTVIGTDDNGCTASSSATITEPDVLDVTVSGTDITCNGDDDGTTTSVVTGGTTAYNYSWDDPSASTTTGLTGLSAGTYTLTVTDDNGCTNNDSYTVTEPTPLTVVITGTDLNCFGICDGTTTATPSGGTAPYTYLWDDGGAQTTGTATALCAGTFGVVVTDDNGCTASGSILLTEPPLLTAATDATTDATCNGDCDGDATASIAGGTGPFTYLWDDPGAQTTLITTSTLCAGSFVMTVTDANSCTATTTAIVSEPDVVSGTVTPTDVSCNAVCDGDVTVVPTGGNGVPYTYLWDDGGASTTATVSSLCAGTYTVTITDPSGCLGTASGVINEPDPIVATASGTDITCNGLTDGTATVSVTGGTIPYTYLWDDAGASTTSGISGLSAATYTVIVTDDNGCTGTDSYDVLEPTLLVVTVDLVTDATCNGDADGAIDITTSGGTAPYTYLWDNGAGVAEDASGLVAGTYTLTVTDDNACTETAVGIVNEPDPLLNTEDLITNTTCNGDSDGAIDITSSGGTAPYTYLWDDIAASTTDDITGLPAGDYTLITTDDNGCTETSTHTVTEPDPITGAFTNVEPSCFGLCDGASLVTASGGTAPYTYLWDDPGAQTSSTANSLCDGTFNVTITDDNSCVGIASVTLTEPVANSVTVTTTDATCDGVCDGTATAAPVGGTAPYTYLWDDPGAQSTITATALCSGAINVTVTDDNGCVSLGGSTVSAPVVVTATITGSNNTSCNGVCDGDATVGGAGGLPPYTYDWSPVSDLNQTTTALCAGSHDGIVIDANGCRDSASVVITEPDPIVITFTETDPLCFGDANGGITSVVSGGTAPYTFLWDDAGATTTIDISGIASGTYCLTVTDDNGCTQTNCTTISDPIVLSAVTFSSNPLCFGSCDGEAGVQPVGGTSPYTYSWAHDIADVDSIAELLCDGVYTGTITDANGCTVAGIVTITDPVVLSSTQSSTNPSCNAICDGTVTMSVSGGNAPYTYLWDDLGAQTTTTATSLCDGTYIGTGTDNNGCIITETVIITEPDPILITEDAITDATCFGDCDGDISITISGGIAPYTFLWDNGAGVVEDPVGLCANTYTVTVTDDNGCQNTGSSTVNEPLVVSGTTTVTNTTCNGDCDGAITLVASGGDNGPYTYLWDDPSGSSTSSIVGLCAGTYNCIVTDGNGCTATILATVTEPDLLIAGESGTNIICNGDCDGEAVSTPIGGTAPYTYLWDDIAASTSDTLGSLCAGVYSVIVTDDNGCMATAPITITEPVLLTASITDTVHVICGCTGSAEVTAVGGVSPYTYLWDDIGAQTSQTASSLCAGSYNVQVTDASGCTVVIPVTISSISDLSATVIGSTDASCFGLCDGDLSITATGGLAPYTYLWDDVSAQTTPTATALCAGTYTCIVTDANGCIFSISGSVNEPDVVSGTISFNQPSCFSLCDGNATVVGTGGDGGPYTVIWDNAQVTLTATGLCAGDYTVTLTDASGCTGTASITVTEPALLIANVDGNNISCNSACDGEVFSVPTGGTAPFTYLWDDLAASITDTVNSLCPGTYSVIVTDVNGCTDTDNTTITEPTLLTSSITDTTHVNCSCVGTAEVTGVGGTLPYTYLWNDIAGQTTQTATALCAGTYNVTVTDGNGCISVSSVTIIDVSGFDATVTDTTHNVCFGECLGEAIATPTGGLLPYTYVWTSSAGVDSTESDLCAGSYFVTVSDANGCARNLPFTITEPTEIDITFVETVSIDCNGNCNGQITATVTNGTAPYTYLWDDPAGQTSNIASGLCAGLYTLTVTDANGCIQSSSYNISQPAILTALISSYNDITCFGDSDGDIIATYGGGTDPVSYSWAPGGEITPSISGLGPNTYTVTVTDANGCSDDSTQVIIEPLLLTSSITSFNDMSCNGICDGDATVTGAGGTAPYSYAWDDGSLQTTQTATGLCSGNYNVIITDANGCSSTSSVTITDPALITVSLDNMNPTSCFVCDGDATISALGGTGAYTYLWDPNSLATSSTATIATDLCATVYGVIVTDANGCIGELDITVTGPAGLSSSIATNTPVTCFGECDGELEGAVVGGTGPYTYTWDSGVSSTSTVADSLCPNTYTFTATDVLGCETFITGTIVQPDSLEATIFSTNPSACLAPGTGDATVTQTGGTGPYTYSWSTTPDPLTASVSGLVAGNYVATVTDANGCIDTANANVMGPSSLTVSLISQANTTCNSGCDGEFEILVSGGNAPYTYLWDDPSAQTTVNPIGLCAGTYTCTINDATGCLLVFTGTITEPDAIVVVTTSMTPSACLVCDGSATVSSTGGTGVHSYLWEANSLGLSSNTTSATDLCASDYTVVVTDINFCVDSIDVTVTGPNGLSAVINSTTNSSCNLSCDGQLIGSGVGGTLPYTYLWNDPSAGTATTIDDLCVGTYTLEVSDAAGCIATVDGVISEPDLLIATVTDSTSSNCVAPGSGTATVNMTGGTGPFTYLWNDPSAQVSQIATGLLTSNYTVLVTDANGCSSSDDVYVPGPASLVISLVSQTNISCNGVCDGEIAVAISGGVAPYSLLWDNTATTTSITNLCGGSYVLTVTDDNGCEATYNALIVEPDALTGSFTSTSMVTCNGVDDGSANFSTVGGTEPYSFSWNPVSAGTDSIATNLAPGNYVLFYGDANGCTNSENLTITEPDLLTSTINSTTNLTCLGVCEGDATVAVQGGTLPYSILWDANDNGYVQSTLFADSLCAQDYDVVILDANGCTTTSTATINDNNALVISTTDTDVSCFSSCDGTGDVNISGGTLPYSILWDNGGTGTGINSLCPDTFFVNVSDAAGCSLVDSIIITEPSLLVSVISASSNLECNGICDGSATVTVSGGSSPYTYLWNDPNSQTTSIASNLCAGTWTCTVTDNNNCVSAVSVVISEPSAVWVDILGVTDVSCYGGNDGAISINSSGGTGGHTYSWSPGLIVGTTLVTGLSAQDYTVVATDALGCESTEVISVFEPNELLVSIIDTTHILCVGVCDGDALALAIGGTAPYTYDWGGGNTGASYSNLCDGTYTVNVTDANSCTASVDVTISTASALNASILPTNISCNGECDGELEAIPIGGVSPYVYSWANSNSTSTVNNLCPTSMLVNISDANGCSISLSGSVSEPSVLTASIVDSTNILCFGNCDGTALAFPQGGTAPYSYTWDVNSNGIQISNSLATDLCAQNYSVSIEDANGCLITAQVTLEEPTELQSLSTTTPSSCNNVDDGLIDLTITGGEGVYSYSWNGPNDLTSNNEDLSSTYSGLYYVTATDGNGCEILDTITLDALISVNAEAGLDHTTCDVDSVILIGSGGESYLWSNGTESAINIVNPSSTTEYILTVTNQSCIDQDTVMVNVNASPSANAGFDHTIVVGGSAQLDGDGAGLEGLYSWNPPIGLNNPIAEDPIATPEFTTIYELVVENAAGCSDTDYVEVLVVPGIVFPNGITPNGDGLNDTWEIQYITQFPAPVVEIYNRWGQLLFRSVGYTDNWDGVYAGKPLPVGTYYYVIELGEGIEPYAGPITIMR